MEDLTGKITGSTLTAVEWNQLPQEVQNIITAAGLTLSNADLNQLGKGLAQYAANGDFYTDSGAADAYVLTAVNSKQAPPSYKDGMRVRFEAANANTGASTVNPAGLGVKSIVDIFGNALTANAISGRTELVFDLSADNFVHLPAPDNGNFAGWIDITTNGTTLNAADAGKQFNITSTAVSTTLPLLSAISVGDAFYFKNSGGTNSNVINANSTDTLIVNDTTTGSVTVENGEDLTVVKISSSSWVAYGSSILQYVNGFLSSKTTNGYQKLPSGLIIQWGTATVNNTTFTSVTYPLAFPTAAFMVVATQVASAAGASRIVETILRTVTYFDATGNSTNNAIYWLAIGH